MWGRSVLKPSVRAGSVDEFHYQSGEKDDPRPVERGSFGLPLVDQEQCEHGNDECDRSEDDDSAAADGLD